MLFPLLLTASVFFHAKTGTRHVNPRPPGHHQSSLSRGQRQTGAITAIKDNVQFMMIVPPTPSQRAAREQIRPRTPPVLLNTPAGEASEERALITAINAERTTRGLEPLTSDPILTEAARSHSREMGDLGYFDHFSPTPALATPQDRYQKTLRDWDEDQPASAMVGENIFYCNVTNDVYNVDYAHRRLMASPGHRANILDARFTKVGVGLYRDSMGRFWVTEMFLQATASPSLMPE